KVAAIAEAPVEAPRVIAPTPVEFTPSHEHGPVEPEEHAEPPEPALEEFPEREPEPPEHAAPGKPAPVEPLLFPVDTTQDRFADGVTIDTAEHAAARMDSPELAEPEPPEPSEPLEPREPFMYEQPDSSRPAVLPTAIGVVLGLLAGFAGGYFVGSRDRLAPETTS